jgi:fructan beta-fructosidase
LKVWAHLSDFGPAGAKHKPNWECPDMFELPIAGEPGQTRWVLEANMGSGSVAGGSGCEYFIGQFDGKKFTPDTPLDHVNWIDYGRDFYAVVSWSDVPKSDGRRIWLAWMNNWETSQQPTYPWRGAMTLPRSLTLRRTADGLRLYQSPVKELESLRGEHIHAADLTFTGDTATIGGKKIAGDKLEIIAEFKPGDATEFGLKVRKGAGEETVIGYDIAKQEVFVDRTKSGKSDFHDKFPGRHSGPLPLENGRVRLHIFVDVSSVEVFGNDGRISITDSIFPNAKSTGLELYSKGGSAQLVSLDVWQLKSAWHP